MTIFSIVVVYVLVWWVIIFCVLPLKITTVDRPKDGTMPGAPVEAGMAWKLKLTTAIATVLWVVICLIIQYGGISFHDMAQGMRM